MARIPPLRRLTMEDFPSQSSWIGALITVFNTFMEQTVQALNKNLTVTDNMSGKLITLQVDGSWPKTLSWSLASKPVSVVVAGFTRVDGSTYNTVLSTTGNTASSTTISSLTSTSNVFAGQLVTGAGIPAGTFVTGVPSSTSVTISQPATATASGVQLTFSVGQAVQAQWQYNSSGQLQIDNVTGITPTNTLQYYVTLQAITG